jgi:hypothetical protein
MTKITISNSDMSMTMLTRMMKTCLQIGTTMMKGWKDLSIKKMISKK